MKVGAVFVEVLASGDAEGEVVAVLSGFGVVHCTAKNIAAPLATRITMTASAPSRSLPLLRSGGAGDGFLRLARCAARISSSSARRLHWTSPSTVFQCRALASSNSCWVRMRVGSTMHNVPSSPPGHHSLICPHTVVPYFAKGFEDHAIDGGEVFRYDLVIVTLFEFHLPVVWIHLRSRQSVVVIGLISWFRHHSPFVISSSVVLPSVSSPNSAPSIMASATG